jgi:hypothetical protein
MEFPDSGFHRSDGLIRLVWSLPVRVGEIEKTTGVYADLSA